MSSATLKCSIAECKALVEKLNVLLENANLNNRSEWHLLHLSFVRRHISGQRPVCAVCYGIAPQTAPQIAEHRHRQHRFRQHPRERHQRQHLQGIPPQQCQQFPPTAVHDLHGGNGHFPRRQFRTGKADKGHTPQPQTHRPSPADTAPPAPTAAPTNRPFKIYCFFSVLLINFFRWNTIKLYSDGIFLIIDFIASCIFNTHYLNIKHSII